MSFVASRHGTCGHGDRVHPGDDVEYNDDDELVHVDCNASEWVLVERVTETCTDCFIQKPCPCEDDQ